MWKLTPAMQQFVDLKKQNPDAILFFRLGDFYETFWEDAKIASKVLDLVLTSKNKNAPEPIPMAGIPHHSAEKYINKLVHKWYKVAIAEQMTAPIPGKVVEREVVSIITPGTYIQEDSSWFNFLMSISFLTTKSGENYHIAWGDFSIGEYTTKSFKEIHDMQNFILRIHPKEIIIDIDMPNKEEIQSSIKHFSNALISIYDKPFSLTEYILQQCKVQTLASFWEAVCGGRLDAFALLLHYIKNTQKTNLQNIVKVGFHSDDDKVIFDETTIKNLEIFSSSYENNEKYSLYGVINTTKTAGGARLLRTWLESPTKNLNILKTRLHALQKYVDTPELSKDIHQIMGNIADLYKITSIILYKKLSVIGFIKLRTLLGYILKDKQTLQEIISLGVENKDLEIVKNVYNYLQKTFKTGVTNDNDFVADWVDEHIDALRKIAFHSDELLLDYQQSVVQHSWISGIKIKFITNQWYFLEVTPKDIQNFEASCIREDEKFDFIRRQTLKSGQRYTSQYLETLQTKILNAKDELQKKEHEILEQARKKIEESINELTIFWNTVSELDLYTSFALFAIDNQLVQPELHSWNTTKIHSARHLVIEKFLDNNDHFIVNDLVIGEENNGEIHIITWPNMGGKSTYLRQNALIVLMAHCGLFVPCTNAKIGIVDGIFARVGSWDIIAKNQSTFMTEMIEVVNILNNATAKSFIIFDELGRGTSTYDGLALTKAILEYISVKLQAKTLIATHYHELIQLEQTHQNIKNFSVSVYETEREVVFMKKIVAWGANKSYGIDVAELAWLPQVILNQARKNLELLQENQNTIENNISTNISHSCEGRNLDTRVGGYDHRNDWENTSQLFTPTITTTPHPEYEKIKSILSSFDINTITPLQAMQLLDKLKGEL